MNQYLSNTFLEHEYHVTQQRSYGVQLNDFTFKNAEMNVTFEKNLNVTANAKIMYFM